MAGRFVDFGRRSHLDDAPLADHADAVGRGERLALVVGNIDRGNAETALQVLIQYFISSRRFLSSALNGSSSSRMRGRRPLARRP